MEKIKKENQNIKLLKSIAKVKKQEAYQMQELT